MKGLFENLVWYSQKILSKEKTLKDINENKLQYYLTWLANKPEYPSSGKYLLCSSASYKFMWFMVPKVATRSIKKHLTENIHDIFFLMDLEAILLICIPVFLSLLSFVIHGTSLFPAGWKK